MGNSHSLEGKIIDEKKWLKYPLARLYDYKVKRYSLAMFAWIVMFFVVLLEFAI